jgi:hypothetical protein
LIICNNSNKNGHNNSIQKLTNAILGAPAKANPRKLLITLKKKVNFVDNASLLKTKMLLEIYHGIGVGDANKLMPYLQSLQQFVYNHIKRNIEFQA